MDDKVIPLVESDPDDELLTLRALAKANIKNEVVVARDGREALDRLLVGSVHDRRDAGVTPEIVLIEPRLPKIDGFEVLERLRSDEQTRHLPVAVFSSSGEEQDSMESHGPDGNIYIRKPVDFAQFSRAVRQLGLRWLVLSGP